jgi:predicted dehydrogenase
MTDADDFEHRRGTPEKETQEQMRGVVVGAGFVGSIHARAVAEHPHAVLVGVCGRTRPKTEALASRYGVTFHLSVDEMLRELQPDFVCVCTGNDEHVAPTVAALEAGAHVFVEKPLAFSLEEAQRMVDTADRAGLKLGVNFNHRFAEGYQRALRFLQGGNVGVPAYASVKLAGDLYYSLNDPYCMLIETQGHSFDLLRLFCGEIEEVSAFLADPRGLGVFTSAAIALRFASGAVGTLLGSWDSSYSHPGSVSFEVSGTDGRVEVENVVDAVRLYQHDRPEFTEWRPGLFDADRRDFWRTIDIHLGAFIQAVRGGQDPPVPGSDGVRALEATFAAIRSFEEHRPVSL